MPASRPDPRGTMLRWPIASGPVSVLRVDSNSAIVTAELPDAERRLEQRPEFDVLTRDGRFVPRSISTTTRPTSMSARAVLFPSRRLAALSNRLAAGAGRAAGWVRRRSASAAAAPPDLRRNSAARNLPRLARSDDVATALPTIVGDLGGLSASPMGRDGLPARRSRVAPVYGKLGDLFGRKMVLEFARGVFRGSILCGLSQNMLELVAFRALQGIGAGGLIVTSLAVVGDIVLLANAVGTRGSSESCRRGDLAVLGPLLGGFFVVAAFVALDLLCQRAAGLCRVRRSARWFHLTRCPQ